MCQLYIFKFHSNLSFLAFQNLFCKNSPYRFALNNQPFLKFSLPYVENITLTFPLFYCSGAHNIQLSKLVLCQFHAFANLLYLPALSVVEGTVVFVQQVVDVHFQQFCNSVELVYRVVVMLRILIMDISAFVNPCIVPTGAGIFCIGNTAACPPLS